MMPKLVFVLLLTVTLQDSNDDKAKPFDKTRIWKPVSSESYNECTSGKDREIERFKEAWRAIHDYTNSDYDVVAVRGICVGVSPTDVLPKAN